MSHTELSWYIALPVILLVVCSAVLCVTAAVGLLRFNTVLERLHTPAIASTMGAILSLLASIVYFSYTHERAVVHELVIILLLVITSPITGILMMKSARRRRQSKDKN